MFEKLRAKRAATKYQRELGLWEQRRNDTAELLDLAQHFEGVGSDSLLLKANEALFASVTNVALVEDRSTGGHWEGRSSGVSIPIGSIGGRSIRYHVGGTRGHYVQGTPVPTAIDVGTVYVTNQRAVFQGAKQTRECRFDKLLAVNHTPDGATVFSVSNRQKPTTIHYGAEVAGWFEFRLDLALAHYRGNVDELVSHLQGDLATVDAARPSPPAAD
jgi:hypothetical protein